MMILSGVGHIGWLVSIDLKLRKIGEPIGLLGEIPINIFLGFRKFPVKFPLFCVDM